MVDEGSGRFTDGISVGVLTRIFHRDLVDDVLRETRRVEQRSRLLPARVVVYYVLALCLFCGDAYEEVMRKLVNGLRFLQTWADDWQVPTSGAISQARTRLGAAPLAGLFDRVAVPIARPGTRGAWFHGRRVMAVDGVVLDVPDTDSNRKEFGKHVTKAVTSPFPQVRLVGLAECGTHAIVAAAFDSQRIGERELLRRILSGLQAGMVVLADRGFYSYELWRDAVSTGADLVWRVTDTVDLPVLEWLPDGSYRSELLSAELKAALRRRLKRGGGGFVPDEERVPVRVVEYMVTNRDETTETIRLITSILDPAEAPAVELAALYHERWEIELIFDEIETHQMAESRVLRSQTAELVRQEIWALLLAHYAVRSFMREAADDLDDDLNDDLDKDVDRLSFIRSIRVIRRLVLNQAGFSPSAPPASDS
jgi:Insertion element 4 transposase N-terminal/Transposase DDE domain